MARRDKPLKLTRLLSAQMRATWALEWWWLSVTLQFTTVMRQLYCCHVQPWAAHSQHDRISQNSVNAATCQYQCGARCLGQPKHRLHRAAHTNDRHTELPITARLYLTNPINMKADIVAKITDDLARVGKDQDGKEDHLVDELTPQAKLLREMAQQAADKPVEGDWDVRPHPLLAAAAPTREQFEAEDTAPVVIMRNPIAGKQVRVFRCSFRCFIYDQMTATRCPVASRGCHIFNSRRFSARNGALSGMTTLHQSLWILLYSLQQSCRNYPHDWIHKQQ